MSDLTAVLLVGVLGVYGLVLSFVALTYRLGGFTLMPGEQRRLISLGGFGLALSLALPFFIPFMPNGLDVLLVGATLALLAYSFFRMNQQSKREVSPEEASEREHRLSFIRSGRCIALAFGFVIAGGVWSLTVVVVTR